MSQMFIYESPNPSFSHYNENILSNLHVQQRELVI
jgi:hypothetical protein